METTPPPPLGGDKFEKTLFDLIFLKCKCQKKAYQFGEFCNPLLQNSAVDSPLWAQNQFYSFPCFGFHDFEKSKIFFLNEGNIRFLEEKTFQNDTLIRILQVYSRLWWIYFSGLSFINSVKYFKNRANYMAPFC